VFGSREGGKKGERVKREREREVTGHYLGQGITVRVGGEYKKKEEKRKKEGGCTWMVAGTVWRFDSGPGRVTELRTRVFMRDP
jgi:hypothetical protein